MEVVIPSSLHISHSLLGLLCPYSLPYLVEKAFQMAKKIVLLFSSNRDAAWRENAPINPISVSITQCFGVLCAFVSKGMFVSLYYCCCLHCVQTKSANKKKIGLLKRTKTVPFVSYTFPDYIDVAQIRGVCIGFQSTNT